MDTIRTYPTQNCVWYPTFRHSASLTTTKTIIVLNATVWSMRSAERGTKSSINNTVVIGAVRRTIYPVI